LLQCSHRELPARHALHPDKHYMALMKAHISAMYYITILG